MVRASPSTGACATATGPRPGSAPRPSPPRAEARRTAPEPTSAWVSDSRLPQLAALRFVDVGALSVLRRVERPAVHDPAPAAVAAGALGDEAREVLAHRRADRPSAGSARATQSRRRCASTTGSPRRSSAAASASPTPARSASTSQGLPLTSAPRRGQDHGVRRERRPRPRPSRGNRGDLAQPELGQERAPLRRATATGIRLGDRDR